jgi:hypothetical protein
MGFPFGRKDTNSHAVWCLTQTGRDEIKASGGDGIGGKILSALDDRGGTGTVEALVPQTGLQYQMIEKVLKRMEKSGYVAAQS